MAMKAEMNTWTKTLLCGAFVAALAGCGGDGSSSSSSAPMGTLQASMTDAPSCGFDHVFVTVTEVRVNANASAGEGDGGWVDVPLPQASAQPIDLLSLTNGVLADLGRTALPAAQYQQVRLVLAANQGNTVANSVVPTGGTTQPLATPSASQSGIKIVRPFTVDPGTLVDLVLDFDACRSVVQQGNGSYSLKPVVTATPTVVSGAISGFVDPAAAGSTVYAEQNNVVIKGTVAGADGHFILSPLIQSSSNGNYDVVIVGGGRATGVVRSVPVAVNTTTDVSTQGAPFVLPASTTNTVSGTVTASAQAVVSGLQNIGGANYAIASTNANADTGAYSLTLPTAAPLAGTYAGTLPVGLTAVPASAGLYTISAQAASGIAQAKGALNVTAGPLTGVNFTF
jgi:hypothetical protein